MNVFLVKHKYKIFQHFILQHETDGTTEIKHHYNDYVYSSTH